MAGVTSSTRVGYCYDPRMKEHRHLDYDHPERPERISSIFELLEDFECTSRMIALPVREVSEAEVTMVHSRKVWERVNDLECKISPPFHLPGAYSVILRSASRRVPRSLARSTSVVRSDDHETDTEQV